MQTMLRMVNFRISVRKAAVSSPYRRGDRVALLLGNRSAFVEIVIGAVIRAVAIRPRYAGPARRLGGRTRLSAALVTAVALAILLVPSAEMLGVTVGEARAVAEQAEAGALRVPAPPAGVREWPLVGERTYSFWFGASRNLDATLETLEPELRAAGRWGLSSLAGLTGAVVQFAVSIFIAGVLLVSGEEGVPFLVDHVEADYVVSLEI